MGSPGCTKGDGIVQGDVTVTSTVRGDWKLYSFADADVLRDDSGDPLTVDDPSTEEGWDLAISQWVIATASGDSVGSPTASRGALLAVEGAVDDWPDLDAFTADCSQFGIAGETENTQVISCTGGITPTVDEGWISDSEDDPDGAGPFPSISYHPSVTFWFEYEFSGHEVIPYGNIYVVETHEGDCVKLQVTDYYDADGDKGNVSFSWAYLN